MGACEGASQPGPMQKSYAPKKIDLEPESNRFLEVPFCRGSIEDK